MEGKLLHLADITLFLCPFVIHCMASYCPKSSSMSFLLFPDVQFGKNMKNLTNYSLFVGLIVKLHL